MPLINRAGIAALLISAALPFAAARPSDLGQPGCQSNDFWYPEKSCCLPVGGLPSSQKPPPQKQCPGDWSWSQEISCCVPHYPSYPPPQCPTGWYWSPGTYCCEKSSDHSSSSPPTPRSMGADCQTHCTNIGWYPYSSGWDHCVGKCIDG